MRAKKELFELMLVNIDKLEKGLCHLAGQMANLDLISFSEYRAIFSEIEKESKLRGLKGWDHIWPEGEKEPRIKWLKKQIKQSENEN